MEITFVIPGEPKAKGRPRFSKVGNFVRTYTPQETQNYEAFIKLCCIEASNGVKLSGAISAEINCIFGIPQSAGKKAKEEMKAGNIPCMKKPDADNIAKSVLDSINTIAYDDDKQVALLTVTKSYGETPMVKVTLQEI